ncbi:ferritin-like domain-containing protein [Zoogloea sp. LCSB751]|uniref:ferritin-like domain-containing protein n=1 Tax=Zoogloea sp. LCSB751 TaxID=1965277 RepID=UPI0020B1286A|nr:ferritin-like domain-containing protein [Zoogloea sp. LCSB751]
MQTAFRFFLVYHRAMLETPENLHARAYRALMCADPAEKSDLVASLSQDWRRGALPAPVDAGACPVLPVIDAGRPDRPELIAHTSVPRRKPSSAEGLAALLHAIAHIEFNAINLALDCVYRFRGLPTDFYAGWLQVAAEEAYHFGLVTERLVAVGFTYGDFSAHRGLWDMAVKTADDPLARMALVPRVLEARGLDATPPIVAKLRKIGDEATIAVLDIILRDEIGHVALGDRWFRHFCAERGLEPEATYLALMTEFDAPWPPKPLNVEARRKAGFSAAEINRLEAGRPRRNEV